MVYRCRYEFDKSWYCVQWIFIVSIYCIMCLYIIFVYKGRGM